LAEDIITTATFGQSTNSDKEEEPIIIAQRFLNIFRQLHIFSKEKKEEFNNQLLKQPKAIRKCLKTLPGGSVLLEYMDDLERGDEVDDTDASGAEETSIVAEASQDIEQAKSATNVTVSAPIIDSDNFAKVLANSLAQSNAQIIKELRNVPNFKAPKDKLEAEQLKLVADETFTKTISNALAEAISASEQKRQEDSKLITQSFLELQENLNKMIEQNNQIKIISNSDAPAEAATAFQIKNVIDDLVKAQSKFLKETTQSQKEELSALISLAIQDSIKLSTQSLIDSFKQLDEDGPTPITYAASSPKKQAMLENVTEALKVQGREFSSIIASTLKESQQNSAQTIIQTIEKLKGTSVLSGDTKPQVEEIMKMQADLFREITRSQNQEFSAIITSALRESQQQSTNAIITALSQMKGLAVQMPEARPSVETKAVPEQIEEISIDDASSLKPEIGISPEKDYTVKDSDVDTVATDVETLVAKKKKKKKKKKNREEQLVIPPIEKDSQTPILDKPLQKKKTIISALPEMPVVEDKPVDNAADWGFGSVNESPAPAKIIEPESNVSSKEQEYASEGDGWTWEYQPEEPVAEEVAGKEGQDWEWEYEEIPEEQPNNELSGTEGQDWEWEYEEIPEDEQTVIDENPQEVTPQEQIVQSSEIIASKDFELILVGADNDEEEDPYFYTVNSVG
jgi:hypothetical protein